MRYSHHIIAIRDGSVLADGAPEAVFTEDLVRELYGVESVVRDVTIAGRRTKLCLPERVAEGAEAV